ncbi:DUF2147 domain-containing protein [Acidocella facilis]|uniref:DUF2147 domain-containing protein n=1 Tax=Acidocella facilis TaxID=525 RepID=UPI00138E1E83|nr:DUF2147 domain-containing protein [Acidocella facilis]
MQAFTFRRLAIFLPALAAGALLGAPASAQPSPQGWWLDQTGKAGIEIAPCGADLCGKIEWLRAPLDAQGKPKTDIHNSNAALQNRPLCGLPILGRFTPDGPGSWKGGWIYDPENGKTYKSVMHLAPDGTLHVRGYVGIPLLGRSETWTRLPAPPTPCAGG